LHEEHARKLHFRIEEEPAAAIVERLSAASTVGPTAQVF
jgi:hypothetical protein